MLHTCRGIRSQFDERTPVLQNGVPMTTLFAGGLIASPDKWERQLRVSGFAPCSGFSGHSIANDPPVHPQGRLMCRPFAVTGPVPVAHNAADLFQPRHAVLST